MRALVTLLAFTAAYLFLDQNVINVSRYEISAPVKSQIRIVQITDLHNKECGKDDMYLLNKIRKEKPDIIAVTGDSITGEENDCSGALLALSGFSKIAPTFVSLGNHETTYIKEHGDGIISDMSDTGVTVLDNRTTDILVNGTKLSICGLSVSTKNYRYDGISVINDFLSHDGYKILLSHYPELYLDGELSDKDIDLALSGHTHGGLIRFLNIGGLYTKDEGLLPPLSKGKFKYGNTNLIVSSGIGPAKPFLRINNFPEIIVIDLVPE